MVKALIFLAVAYLGWRWWQGQQARVTDAESAPSAAPPPDDAASATMMVQCAHCGVHVPQHEALTYDTQTPAAQWFCCAEHRQAHSASHSASHTPPTP